MARAGRCALCGLAPPYCLCATPNAGTGGGGGDDGEEEDVVLRARRAVVAADGAVFGAADAGEDGIVVAPAALPQLFLPARRQAPPRSPPAGSATDGVPIQRVTARARDGGEVCSGDDGGGSGGAPARYRGGVAAHSHTDDDDDDENNVGRRVGCRPPAWRRLLRGRTALAAAASVLAAGALLALATATVAVRRSGSAVAHLKSVAAGELSPLGDAPPPLADADGGSAGAGRRRDYARPVSDREQADAIWSALERGDDAAAASTRPAPPAVDEPLAPVAHPAVEESWATTSAANWHAATAAAPTSYLPPEPPERQRVVPASAAAAPAPAGVDDDVKEVSPLVALVDHRAELEAAWEATAERLRNVRTLTLQPLPPLAAPVYASHTLGSRRALHSITRVVLLLHGCGGSGATWVEGPSERAFLGELLAADASVLVVAPSAAAAAAAAAAAGAAPHNDGCWSSAPPAANADVAAVSALLDALAAAAPGLATAPVSVVGVSSGGTFGALLATAVQVDTLALYVAPLHARLVDGLPTAAQLRSRRRSASGRVPFAPAAARAWAAEATRVAAHRRPHTVPDVVWVVMPADRGLAAVVAAQQGALLAAGVGATAYAAPPLAVTPALFADAAPSRITRRASAALVQYLVDRLALRPLAAADVRSADARGADARGGAARGFTLTRPARDAEVTNLVTSFVATRLELPLRYHALRALRGCRAALCAPHDMLLDLATDVTFDERFNLDLPLVPVADRGAAGAAADLTAAALATLAEAEGFHAMSGAHAPAVVTLLLRARTRAA